MNNLQDLNDENQYQKPLNWNKNGVWERIEAQQKPTKKLFVIWRYAAAVFVLLGLSFWFLRDVQDKQVTLSKPDKFLGKSHSKPNLNPAPQERGLSLTKAIPQSKLRIDENKTSTDLPIQSLVQEDALIRNIGQNIPENPPIITETQNLNVQAQASIAAISPAPKQNTAKKLVLNLDYNEAELYLPPTIEVAQKRTFKERLEEVSKRYKKDKKLDLKLLDKNPEGFWAFVQNSFEVPTE